MDLLLARFCSKRSTAHVIKVKRSDLTESLQPDKLSASSIYHETNGGIHAIPLFARHMQHVKQTVREKVKSWRMWQHLCVCALMVIKYHHGPSTKESQWQRCPYQAASWWSARAVWHCQHARDGLPVVCVWVQSTATTPRATCPLRLRARVLKRITEELLCAFNEGVVLIESAPVCLALLLRCLDVFML